MKSGGNQGNDIAMQKWKIVALCAVAASPACAKSDTPKLEAAALKCGIDSLKFKADQARSHRYLVDLPFVQGGFSAPSSAEYLGRQKTNSKVDCLNAQLTGSGISVISSRPVIIE